MIVTSDCFPSVQRYSEACSEDRCGQAGHTDLQKQLLGLFPQVQQVAAGTNCIVLMAAFVLFSSQSNMFNFPRCLPGDYQP